MARRNADVTAEQVREMLSYNSETGQFQWRRSPAPNVNAGQVAGYLIPRKGYVQIAVSGRRYTAHRLAWLYVHGVWPTQTIDHINGDRSDNSIGNLRDVSMTVNRINGRTAFGSKRRGIRKTKSGLWRATAYSCGRIKSLGLFHDEISALNARKQFEMTTFGEYACRTEERPKYAD